MSTRAVISTGNSVTNPYLEYGFRETSSIVVIRSPRKPRQSSALTLDASLWLRALNNTIITTRTDDLVANAGAPVTDQEWRQAQIEKNRPLLQLVQSWVEEGDEEEQSETLDYLTRVLDEDRSSKRKLFP